MTPEALGIATVALSVADAPRPRDRRGGLSFPLVFGVFVTLLALGIWGGVRIHRSYVGFERVAAHHVPPDATLVLRWDVEKVSLFEPTRRFLLPLLDKAALPHGAIGPSRRERYAKQSGVVFGRDLREVLVAFGPGESDWSVLLGGSFPSSDIVAAAARTLREDGVVFQPLGPRRIVAPGGMALGQGDDGVLVVASSAARLEAALATHPLVPEIPRLGAAALVVGPARAGLPPGGADLLVALGSPQTIRGDARWGNPLPVSVELEFASEPPADLKARIAHALDRLFGEDFPRLERQYGAARVQPNGNRAIRVDLSVDDMALERAANRAAEAVESASDFRPAQK
jgi:hypothetical protein